jgi:hypothetical protein
MPLESYRHPVGVDATGTLEDFDDGDVAVDLQDKASADLP